MEFILESFETFLLKYLSQIDYGQLIWVTSVLDLKINFETV